MTQKQVKDEFKLLLGKKSPQKALELAFRNVNKKKKMTSKSRRLQRKFTRGLKKLLR